MADSWATSGVDLHLELTGRPVRAGLEAALREAVRAGRLRPGSRLPSSRALSRDLGLARNTVADAYGQLVAEGWLAARPGSGTVVAERPAPVEPAVPIDVAGHHPTRYDLRTGSPDLTAFPRSAWLAAARRALAVAPADTLGYGDPRGLPVLRQALADYLSRARGVRASPDRIVVCSGFTQGLSLVCQALRSGGAGAVGMESYSYRGHREVVAATGLRVVTMPVDTGGAVLDDLTADAAVLTPAHQFPLGMPLAPARRTAAVRRAARLDSWLVEDDYDGEFRYDRQAVGALQALAPERVIYAGTASKSLAPGVRLGWLVLPAALVGPVTAAKAVADRQTGSLDQLALAEFISSGGYDRQIRRCRLSYRRRRDTLLAALRRQVPAIRLTGVAAGLHTLALLPPGQQEDTAVARAARHGVGIEGVRTYHAGGPEHPPALVIGYGTPPPHAFSTAVARLTAALRDDTPLP
ncbi:MAG TPA: PLP-dependent aminotransferase family protein [Mycobacteriales bacterium]|nr:PLP-dependent aminotransferase family protein [Mycobacteriales bacterium]